MDMIPPEVWGWFGDAIIAALLRRVCRVLAAIPRIPRECVGAVHDIACGRYKIAGGGQRQCIWYDDAIITAQVPPYVSEACGKLWNAPAAALAHALHILYGARQVVYNVSVVSTGGAIAHGCVIELGNKYLFQLKRARRYTYVVKHYRNYRVYYSDSPPADFIGCEATIYAATLATHRDKQN